MSNNWIEEAILNADKLTAAQKVIEVLATNPNVTFEKLLEMTSESEFDIRQVLSMYSSTMSYKPFYGPHVSHDKAYTDFLIHNIMTITQIMMAN
jgi:hypothetical protein